MTEWLIGLAVVMAVAAGALAVWQRRQLTLLRRQVGDILAGTDDRSMVGRLASHHAILKKQDARIRELVGASEYLHTTLQSAIRKVSFERYNPFPGVGGNQSFTLVLLDAHNSGVILTSLHNRDATRVYAKAIREGAPAHQLSSEEERVLQNALQQTGA